MKRSRRELIIDMVIYMVLKCPNYALPLIFLRTENRYGTT